MSTATVRETIDDYLKGRTRCSTEELGALLVTTALDDVRISKKKIDGAMIETLLCRGANSAAREGLKHRNEKEQRTAQEDLFSGEAYAWLGKDFAKIRVMTLAEYDAAVKLKEESARSIFKVAAQMRKNRRKLKPFWGPEMTYGDAHAAWSERNAGKEDIQ